ncbi:MAG: polysaccharide pyruvyl transferase family protein [Desmonostoc vinosum HA7617-LM4]|jgi:hypothetical protein|nr:polysaccharide pyruvyl transferase family protein [Desmonostoc vinosum HA7617-LM4]
MKVGILTFHHTTNYGATLQAYALMKTIERQGYEVEIIDYRPHSAIQYYRKDIQKTLANKRQLIRPKTIVFLVNLLIKRLKMDSFLNSHIKLSRYRIHTNIELKNSVIDYHVIVAGSDQIWCLDSYRGFDSSFFLDFVNSKVFRKVSYAASVNNTNTLGDRQKVICELISDFDAISVRDSHSLRLIENECGRLATQVLDPTFLFDFNEIKAVPKLKQKFLLVYHDGEMEPYQESFIKAIAEIGKLTIISIGTFKKIADKSLIAIGAEEWLGYLSKASYVVTNTYHGTIFAIKFKKPFNVFANKYKTNKIGDLLENLNLMNRLVGKEESNSIGENLLQLDYSLVDEKLEKEIFRSRAYLFDALKDENVQLEQ